MHQYWAQPLTKIVINIKLSILISVHFLSWYRLLMTNNWILSPDLFCEHSHRLGISSDMQRPLLRTEAACMVPRDCAALPEVLFHLLESERVLLCRHCLRLISAPSRAVWQQWARSFSTLPALPSYVSQHGYHFSMYYTEPVSTGWLLN